MATPVARPRKAPASWPSCGLPATSSAPASAQSGASSTASTSMRPMRPEAPAIAMRSGAARLAVGRRAHGVGGSSGG